MYVVEAEVHKLGPPDPRRGRRLQDRPVSNPAQRRIWWRSLPRSKPQPAPISWARARTWPPRATWRIGRPGRR